MFVGAWQPYIDLTTGTAFFLGFFLYFLLGSFATLERRSFFSLERSFLTFASVSASWSFIDFLKSEQVKIWTKVTSISITVIARYHESDYHESFLHESLYHESYYHEFLLPRIPFTTNPISTNPVTTKSSLLKTARNSIVLLEFQNKRGSATLDGIFSVENFNFYTL